MKKLIYFVEKVYGDDLGRGKSKTSKHRHRKILRTRLRRLLNRLYPIKEE